MIEHNAFCNSEPQEDALCGCVDNYDLTDWNDIEPPDWEGGDAPHQRSCLCNGENGDAYDNRDPDGCRNCCEGESCDGCRDPEMELFIPKASSQQQPESGTQRPIVYNCLLYTSDAADDLLCVDLGGRRIIKKKKRNIS